MPGRIAILGGGIAGAACCLRLAALGHRPVWVTQAQPVDGRPGELLSAAARPILARLGVADLLDDPDHRPAHSMLSAWGSPAPVERTGMVHLEGPQTVLDRAVFEHRLTVRAGQLADVIDARVHGCTRGTGGWIVDTASGQVPCAFVVDATGRAAVLARHHAARFRADRLAVLYGTLEQTGRDVEPTRTTLVEATPDGWAYATCLADGRLVVNFYTDADLMRTSNGGDRVGLPEAMAHAPLIRRWIEEAAFDLSAPLARASAATVWNAPCAGSDWLAIGDAAAAFDPLSSHGMTTALWTGLKGAEAALASLSGDAERPEAYAAQVALGVQSFLAERTRVYAQEQRFSDRPFWQRRAHPMPVAVAAEAVPVTP